MSCHSRCLEHIHSYPLCSEVAGISELGRLAREAEVGRLVMGYGRLCHFPKVASNIPMPIPARLYGEWRGGVYFPPLDLGLGLRTGSGPWDGSKHREKV